MSNRERVWTAEQVERALIYRAKDEDDAVWPDDYSDEEQIAERVYMRKVLQAALAQNAQGEAPIARITANQAQALLDAFGGSACIYELFHFPAGRIKDDDGSDMPQGLYVAAADYPEEGAIYLGDDDEDSEPRDLHAERARVPAGMVLVPREPTVPMLAAMAESYWGEAWNEPGMGDDRLIDARNMYDDALAAAPSQPAAEEVER